MAKTSTAETFGTFTKGDQERTASSRSEAVSLRFTGWAEKGAKTTAAPAATSTAKPADKP